MKKYSLFILLAVLFFFAGCGGGSDYDKYGNGDSVNDSDADKSDSADTQDQE